MLMTKVIQLKQWVGQITQYGPKNVNPRYSSIAPQFVSSPLPKTVIMYYIYMGQNGNTSTLIY
jgi:hypothetical protein